jgi:hypothetical protein
MRNHYRAAPDWRERNGQFSDLKIRTPFEPSVQTPGPDASYLTCG